MRPSTSPRRGIAVCRARNFFPPEPSSRISEPPTRQSQFFSVVSCRPRAGSSTQHPVATMSTGQFEMEPGEIDPYGYVIAAIGFACFTHFYGSIKVRYHTHSR